MLYHFGEVGITAAARDKLVVKLNDPTPYFLDLVAFYPLYPVNRACIEEHSVPNWTKPANIVTNGPFKMQFRRIRDRIRMEKNPDYWDADNVELETVDALAVESQATQLNMYMNGQVDWATDIPSAMIPELEKRDDFYNSTQLATYFYRVNVTKPPLDDHRVREALNMAMNKAAFANMSPREGKSRRGVSCRPVCPAMKARSAASSTSNGAGTARRGGLSRRPRLFARSKFSTTPAKATATSPRSFSSNGRSWGSTSS